MHSLSKRTEDRVGITDDGYLDIITKTLGNPQSGDYISHNGSNWVKTRPFTATYPVGDSVDLSEQNNINGISVAGSVVSSPNTLSVVGQTAYGTRIPMSMTGTDVTTGFSIETVNTNQWGVPQAHLSTLPKAPAITGTTAIKNVSLYPKTIYTEDLTVRFVPLQPSGSAADMTLRLAMAVYSDSDTGWVFANKSISSDPATISVPVVGSPVNFVDKTVSGAVTLQSNEILVPLLIAEME